jgi:hypothetical protein
MNILKTYEHKGRVLQLTEYNAPIKLARPQILTSRAPGAGKFQIGQVDLLQSGSELALKVQISGKGIAYIFSEVLFENGKQYYGPVMREYVSAQNEKETSGVKRPVWDATINILVTLQMRLTLLTDGVNSAFAFVTPQGYGVSGCWLDGQYASGELQTRARISFDSNGGIAKLTAFKDQGIKSMPYELTPKLGDTFAPFVQVFTPPIDKSEKWEMDIALSTPLVFGDQPFQMEKESPVPGEYLAGFLIQDLDGGLTREYISFALGK